MPDQSTSRVVMLKVFLSSDHVSAATGKTVAIKISKAGGAFADPNAGATNATEVSNGWYKVTLDTTDTNTLGDLVVRGTAASCDDSERVLDIISSQAAIKAKTDSLTFTVAGLIDANVLRNAGTAITAASGVQEVKVQSIANDAITAASAAADFGTEVGTAVWASATRVLTAGTNIGTVSANVVQVNSVTVNGIGTAGNPWGP